MDKNSHSGTDGGVRRPQRSLRAWLRVRDSPENLVEALPRGGFARWLMPVAILLGVIAALVGAGHLVAWLGGYLSQSGLTTITMKTNAALCLTLVGVALMLLVPEEDRWVRRWLVRACAGLSLLLGLLTLVENLSGWNLGIDQLLATETPGAMAVVSPNRMGVPASLSFTLIGLALLILSRRDHRGVRAAQALAMAVCLISLLAITGVLYGAAEFHEIARYTAIAWPTAVALLLLGLGLLCARPAEGLMAQVTANDAGGVSIRRLLPAFVILPLLLGWLRLAGERAGVFDAPMGTGMTMLIFIVIFSALAYHAGRRASRSAKALREGEQRLRFALETSHTGAWDLDLADHTAHRSLEHDRIFGYKQLLPQWTYEMFLDHVLPEDRAAVDAKFRAATAARSDWSFECRIRRVDGAVRWIWVAGRHREDAAGCVRRMAGIVQDITERKQAEEAIKWSARRDEVLSQTAARLLQSDDPQSLVEELCRQVMDFLDCHAFFNFLVDKPSGRLHLNACAGISEGEARQIEWLDYGVAVCGCVARDGARIIAEDIQNTTDPRTELVKSYGIRAYCCHPLKVQNRLIGTLSFGTRSRGRFSPEEIDMMRVVTDLVAMAMHRIEIEKALRELNTTLESKVAQRTAELARRARQLQKLTLELSQAEERERRRIAVILHEDLQQQIAGAKFHLSLVRSRARDDSQRAYVDKVDEMLTGAIEESRDLSRDLSPTVVHMNDLTEVLQWLVNRVRAQHGLIVNVDVLGDMTLHSEALAMFLFRAAQEMLFNVVKHAHVNEAAIRARRVGRYMCLSVSDQGRGFDPEQLQETAGIGLFSIRERTELLGGRMKARSVKGKGSRFSIMVPDGLNGKSGRTTEAMADPHALSSTAGSPSRNGTLRVLLVDDHEIVREGLAALLQDAPDIVIVGEAADGREAIDMTERLTPDVVIMDVSMPLMSGDEATRQIKQHRPSTRVVALSMYDEVDKRERMYAAGAEAYVLKTAPSEELLAAIRGN